jgi:hypothetical protein
MGKLVYLTDVSLDLLIEDEHGSLDWKAPCDEAVQSHLTAEFAGIWAAATREASR